MAYDACSVHSSSPARPVDRQTAVPCVALIYLYAFQAAVLDRDTPSTTHPVDLVVSRETCSGPLHWYSVDTVRTPLYRPHGHSQAPMRKRRTRNPSEEIEQPATRLRAKHRLSAHANRRTREFCSSHRSVYGIPSSYSSLAERPVPPPGRGLSIPFPHANMIPGALARRPPDESARVRSFSDSLLVSRETCSAQAQHSCTCSVGPEELNGLLQPSGPTDNVRRNAHAPH